MTYKQEWALVLAVSTLRSWQCTKKLQTYIYLTESNYIDSLSAGTLLNRDQRKRRPRSRTLGSASVGQNGIAPPSMQQNSAERNEVLNRAGSIILWNPTHPDAPASRKRLAFTSPSTALASRPCQFMYLAMGCQINLASTEFYRVSYRLDMPLKGEE